MEKSREEKHQRKVDDFLSRQLKLAGNGRVVSMKRGEWAALIIEFENGHKLVFDSYGADESACAQILVAGSDTCKGPQFGRNLDEYGIDLKLPYE